MQVRFCTLKKRAAKSKKFSNTETKSIKRNFVKYQKTSKAE